MRRYFISQYPTFGSYANPTKWKIEQSPYFYWWLALTLNGDYVALCGNPSANRFKTKKKLLKVYEDFGDVRYEGDRYVAFAKWWNAKLANGETKGAYLFAEPLTEMKVELVEDIGPVPFSCRPKCSFRPLSVRRRQGFSSPKMSVAVADCRSH